MTGSPEYFSEALVSQGNSKENTYLFWVILGVFTQYFWVLLSEPNLIILSPSY